MKRHTENNTNGLSRLISQLMADRKKTVFALSLIALMLFMWVRVFIKKGPATAAAAPGGTVTSGQQENSKTPMKVTFVELPEVQGRNDCVSRDFFDSQNWDEFLNNSVSLSGVKEVNMVSGSNLQEIKRVADKLKLESIWMGSEALAYINNKPLKVADKLPIREGGKTYEFEVVSIVQNEVVIRCEGAQVSLKLSQITGNSK
jgi:hypothetical protein